MTAVTIILWPIVRALARRLEGRGAVDAALRADVEQLRQRLAEVDGAPGAHRRARGAAGLHRAAAGAVAGAGPASTVERTGDDVSGGDALAFVALMFGLVEALHRPVATAIADRIRGRHAPAEDPALADEVGELRGRLAEVEERLDFAERLLAQARETDQLPGERIDDHPRRHSVVSGPARRRRPGGRPRSSPTSGSPGRRTTPRWWCTTRRPS